jgi:hypothetical protein
LESYSERCYLFQYLQESSLSFPLRVSSLTLRSLIHFKLIFVHGLASVFYIWISNFPNTICWRGCLFSKVCFCFLCPKSGCCSCVCLFLDVLVYSIDL